MTATASPDVTSQELYKVVADRGLQYVAGMLTMYAVFHGARKTAQVARQMGLPIEVALYAVRSATVPLFL